MSEENQGGGGGIGALIFAILSTAGAMVAVGVVAFASWKFMDWLRQRAPLLAMAVMMGGMTFVAVKVVPMFAPLPAPGEPMNVVEQMQSMLPIMGGIGVCIAVLAHFFIRPTPAQAEADEPAVTPDV